MIPVHFDENIVGTWHGNVDPNTRFLSITKMPEMKFSPNKSFDEQMTIPTYERIEIPIGMIRRRFDATMQMTSRLDIREILSSEGIHPDCLVKSERHPENDVIALTIPVLTPSPGNYEFLFCQDLFEPR